MDNLLVYESWNLDFKDIPSSRSYLYHLQPVGVGSAQVESLTGYIARLAEAHHVSTGALVSRELLPRARPGVNTATKEAARLRHSTFIYDAHVLNGVGECARRWVGVLEQLTGQASLHLLTLLTWAQVVSTRCLLRSNRAWCPHCYDSWWKAKLTIYEPLLWAISFVTACPVHRQPLEDTCPSCNRSSPVLTAKAKPGHCHQCRNWLGRSVGERKDNRTISNGLEVSIADELGKMLARAPRLKTSPSRVCFKENLKYCIAAFAHGNQSAFARATHLSLDALTHWLSENATFRLSYMVQMCRELRVSPARFVTERISATDPDCEYAQHLFARQRLFTNRPRPVAQVHRALESALNSPAPVSLQEVARELGYPSVYGLRRRNEKLCNAIVEKHGDLGRTVSRRTDTKLYPDRNAVRKRLKQILQKPGCRTLAFISKEFGFCHTSSLYHRARDLCRAVIVENRRQREREDQRIQAVMTRALEEHPAPSPKEIAARLGYRPKTLKYRCPRLFTALAARWPERQLVEKERIRRMLEAALEQDPAPPVKSVAHAAGRGPGHLRTMFPKLCRRIGQRHVEQRRRDQFKRQLKFRAEVREVVAQLCERGINPSRRHVFSEMKTPSMRSTRALDQYISLALGELAAESRILADARRGYSGDFMS